MELIQLTGPKTQTISSLEIAELTGKLHKNIIRDIKNIIEDLEDQENITGLNFEPSEYKDSTGRILTMYNLDRNATLLLASGYDVVLRLKIIQRMEELSNAQPKIAPPSPTPPTMKEMAQWVIKIEEEKESLQLQIKINAPKVEYVEKVLTSDTGIIITKIAKELGMSANKLNASLHNIGVQYKSGKTWLLYAKYQNLGYTKSVTTTFLVNNSIRTNQLTVWTETGREFIHSVFNPNYSRQIQLL